MEARSSELGRDISLVELLEQFEAVILCCGSRQSYELHEEWTSIPGVFGAREILYQPSISKRAST